MLWSICLCAELLPLFASAAEQRSVHTLCRALPHAYLPGPLPRQPSLSEHLLVQARVGDLCYTTSPAHMQFETSPCVAYIVRNTYTCRNAASQSGVRSKAVQESAA